MTIQMRQFLTELVELVRKHDVEIDIPMNYSYSGNSVDGLRITQAEIYNSLEDRVTRQFCEVTIPGEFFDADILQDRSGVDEN